MKKVKVKIQVSNSFGNYLSQEQNLTMDELSSINAFVIKAVEGKLNYLCLDFEDINGIYKHYFSKQSLIDSVITVIELKDAL